MAGTRTQLRAPTSETSIESSFSRGKTRVAEEKQNVELRGTVVFASRHLWASPRPAGSNASQYDANGRVAVRCAVWPRPSDLSRFEERGIVSRSWQFS